MSKVQELLVAMEAGQIHPSTQAGSETAAEKVTIDALIKLLNKAGWEAKIAGPISRGGALKDSSFSVRPPKPKGDAIWTKLIFKALG